MTIEIPLTQGLVALIDDEDFSLVGNDKWHLHSNEKWRYAGRAERYRDQNGKPKRRNYLMHRVIMNPPAGMVIDHIDGNGLNNTRENLRICTTGENLWNARKAEGCTSKFKGVSIRRDKGCYQAQIMVKGDRKHLGYFKTQEEAAEAYNRAKKEKHGVHGLLNVIE